MLAANFIQTAKQWGVTAWQVGNNSVKKSTESRQCSPLHFTLVEFMKTITFITVRLII